MLLLSFLNNKGSALLKFHNIEILITFVLINSAIFNFPPLLMISLNKFCLNSCLKLLIISIFNSWEDSTRKQHK